MKYIATITIHYRQPIPVVGGHTLTWTYEVASRSEAHAHARRRSAASAHLDVDHYTIDYNIEPPAEMFADWPY